LACAYLQAAVVDIHIFEQLGFVRHWAFLQVLNYARGTHKHNYYFHQMEELLRHLATSQTFALAIAVSTSFLISFSMSLKKGKMVIVKEEYTKTLDVLCLRHPNRWYNSRCYVFRLQFFIYNAYLELLGCCQNGPISAF
jgi:hypothetical protein